MVTHRFRGFFEPGLVAPWRLLNQWEKESSGQRQRAIPQPFRAWSSEESVVLEWDAPGIDPEGCEVSVEDDTVRISLPASGDRPDDESRMHLQERFRAPFSQQLRLPFPIDSAKTDASYANGILRLKLERREESKPARVAVKAL